MRTGLQSTDLPTTDFKSNEVILFMKDCKPERLVPNKIMLVFRNLFLLENHHDFMPYEYNEMLIQSGCAGIVRE